MDTVASFKQMLTTANFGAKTRDAITEFCCSSLRELADIPTKDLDASISNLHKSLANIDVVRDRVRLNATKCITLHAIRLHCLDCINCKAEYTADKFVP